MKRISVQSHGTIHYVANCEICEWGACMFTTQTPTEEKVRQAARRHVFKTGHTVTIESGKSVNYVLENDQQV